LHEGKGARWRSSSGRVARHPGPAPSFNFVEWVRRSAVASGVPEKGMATQFWEQFACSHFPNDLDLLRVESPFAGIVLAWAVPYLSPAARVNDHALNDES
jgi:hypothetical protein